MKLNLPALISAGIAGIATVLAAIAQAPPELQAQIPQMFPETQRGTITLWLHVIQAIAVVYAAHAASQTSAPTVPPQPPITKP